MITDDYFNGKRALLSLKWRTFVVLSLVLASVNASLAYLVFRKTTGQFEAEQASKRLAQVRELNVVLSNGLESISTFASFVPLLSVSEKRNPSKKISDRISAVLGEHGVMLDVEWGVEGVHYFGASQLEVPATSWPEGRPAPRVANLLALSGLDEMPRGRLVCDSRCFQIATLPILQKGQTAGYLVIERSIADSLREFYLLSGADIVLLDRRETRGNSSLRRISAWEQGVPAISHEDRVLPILRSLAGQFSLSNVVDEPRRVQLGYEWYEIFAIPAAQSHPDLTLLVVNRVTGQVDAIRGATTDSLILGLAGLVLSEMILLLLMWGPMQRIQDVVYALPLLAEKSFASLRDELPGLPADRRPRDEIDLMINVIKLVAEQIETLDEARSQAEGALRDREQRLQLAQSMARVAGWVAYPIEGVFTLGEEASQIDAALECVETWEDFLALVHPRDRSDLRVAWRRARNGSLLDVEFRLLIGDRTIDLHVKAKFEIVGSRRVLRATGMMQDISEMREVQRTLRDHRDRLEGVVSERTSQLVAARNEAESLAQAKGQFLANMSHEIRTPMNAVLGLAQLGLRDGRDRKIVATFEQILEAGEHLLMVVNDVLDMSKLEAGKLAVDTQPFELRAAISKCTRMLEQRIEAKSLTMSVHIAKDVPEWLLGDVFRIQQILINLLSNAVKFTEQGSVTIDVYRDANGSHCFKVIDTGIGMSADQVGRLFVPFHQVDNSRTSDQEGTGLGLSISNTLAVLMGGDIRVSSRDGIGSEFVLRLPLKEWGGARPSNRKAPVASPTGERRLVGIRILVADDVSINRTVMEALLEAEGALVTTVSDGAEAVSTLQQCVAAGFDLVLMDLEMPVMDGRQATRRIRELQYVVPIIGVTAHASADERNKSLASGMNEQLVKPVMQEILVRTILQCLSENRPDSSFA